MFKENNTYFCRRYPVIAQRVEDRVVDWVDRSSGALRGFCQVELTILV